MNTTQNVHYKMPAATLPPVGQQMDYWDERICVSVCEHFRNTCLDLTKYSEQVYLWPWSTSEALTALY